MKSCEFKSICLNKDLFSGKVMDLTTHHLMLSPQVIAHEISHSWTGNLVTNKTWDHFWYDFFSFFFGCYGSFPSPLPPPLFPVYILFLFLMVTLIHSVFKDSATPVTVVDPV